MTNPKPVKAFLPGDPDGRAAAAGRKAKGVPKRTPEQKEADRRLALMINRMPQLPQGHETPTAMEIAEMGRTFAPGALDFAASVLTDTKAALSDKFQAANLLLRHGASTNAAEQQEITQLTNLLDQLREEHQTVVADMQAEITALRGENDALRANISPPPRKATHSAVDAAQ